MDFKLNYKHSINSNKYETQTRGLNYHKSIIYSFKILIDIYGLVT
jgi:hypothetical protein